MDGFLKCMQTLCQTINRFQENANYRKKSKTFLCITYFNCSSKKQQLCWMQIKERTKFPSELHQTMYLSICLKLSYSSLCSLIMRNNAMNLRNITLQAYFNKNNSECKVWSSPNVLECDHISCIQNQQNSQNSVHSK